MINQSLTPEQEELNKISSDQEMAKIERVPAQAPEQELAKTYVTADQAASTQGLEVLPADQSIIPEDPTGMAQVGDIPKDIAVNAFSDVKAGTEQELEAHAVAQEQEAKLKQEAVKAKSEINKAYQDKLQEINAIRGKSIEDYYSAVNQAPKEIDPSRWWNKLSTGQKIRAGIAQIMAGLGGNRFDPIGDAVKADILAQKEALARGDKKAAGIYAYYKDKGANDMESAKLAYGSALKLVDDQLNAQLMKTKAPQTRSKIMAAKGKISLEQAKLFHDWQKDALDRMDKGKEKGKMGAEEKKAVGFLQSALKQVKSMRTLMRRGHKGLRVPGFESKFGYRRGMAATQLLRYDSGAAITEEERKEYVGMFPTIGDFANPGMAKYKLDIMENQLKDKLSLYQVEEGNKPKKYRFKKSK